MTEPNRRREIDGEENELKVGGMRASVSRKECAAEKCL